MRLSSALSVLALSAIPSAYAVSRSHPVVAARQAHPRRALLDVCAALDVDLKLDAITKNGVPVVVGHLDVCLCVSLVPTFVEVNVVAQAASLLLGKSEVVAIIEALINAAPGHQQCHYPDHSSSICEANKPCGFNCIDGYQPYPATNPTTCNCPPPYSECNGKCGNFPNGCASPAPLPRKRTSSVPTCSNNREVCGVHGGKGWDCVDTKSDVESCGGCVIRSPFTSAAATGKNCRALPHVSSALCNVGKCLITGCKDGFRPSATGEICVAVSVSKRDVVADVHEAVGVVVDPLLAVGEAGVVHADVLGVPL